MSELPKVPGLFRRGQSSQWQFRRRVPEKLQAIVGKTEIVKSLGTADYVEATKLARLETVETDRQFERAREQRDASERFARLEVDKRPGTVIRRHANHPRVIPAGQLRTEIDDVRIKQIAYSWLLELEKKGDKRLTSGKPRSDDDLATELENIDIDEADLQHGISTGRLGFTSLTARRLLLENGFELDRDGEAFGRLQHFVAKAWLEHARRMRSRLSGGWNGAPFDELFAVDLAAAALVKPISAGKTFASVVDEYVNRPRRRIKGKTRVEYERLLRMIEDAFGASVRVDDLTRERCKEFQALVSRLPANAGKRSELRNMPMRKAVEKAEVLHLKPMADKTINKYVAALSTILKFAAQEGYIAANPGQGLMMPIDPRRRRNARRPFGSDQLKVIFANLPHTEIEQVDMGRSWAPLIALFSGMRSGEILQLETSDIEKVDGVDVIHVRENYEPDDLDPDLDFDEEGKRLKTEAARRTIPMHAELVRFGLPQFVKAQRGRGLKALFPAATRSNDGYLSSNFQKWFGRYLVKIGAKTDRTSFHSFRHNFRDAMREARIPLEIVRTLGGWTRGSDGTEDDYGLGFRAATLKDEVDKVAYPGLDLSHLYRNGS